MLSKAKEWKLITTVPKVKMSKAYGRDTLIDPDTGMRPKEILRMRIEHIDWANRRV